MIRSTMRHDPANCKVYFAKIRFLLFFLFTIMYITQKSIIFAAKIKNDTKLQQIFYINK